MQMMISIISAMIWISITIGIFSINDLTAIHDLIYNKTINVSGLIHDFIWTLINIIISRITLHITMILVTKLLN